MRYCKVFIYQLLILQLVLGTWFPNQAVSASTSSQTEQTSPTKILEITDSGASDLQSSLGTNHNYQLTTYSMKKFVALREELDGKYDLIYIGSSNRSPMYSTATASPYTTDRSTAHDTTLKMNDITQLKANEIINDFINKGQLVVLENDVFSQSSSNLYQKFQTYRNNSKQNVKVVSSVKDAVEAITNSSAYTSKRPRFELTESPISYLSNQSYIYNAGDLVKFQYNVNNLASFNSNRLTANLYFDTDYNHKYETVEIMKSAPVSGSTGSISYVLPPGFSGLRYWKLEVVDSATGLKDYQTGILRIRDHKVAVKVLQVMKPGVSSELSADPLRMNQSYLHSDDYDITIDIVNMTQFNSSVYSTINGKYDMIIFGFADVYNNAKITDDAAKAVEQFIATGQSVMFTHDTIFESGNNWVKYFMNDTGQLNTEKHDLGLGAPQTSKTTLKVNSGLMNQFPFLLSDKVSIATTHDQYYRLDLEDSSIIPWYNITGGTRDPNDSWYHYYTYSKGNVTYSGTGHTSNAFPDEEQRLFVNTMYRAFIGSNHAPLVTVYTPTESTKIKQGQNMDVVYQVHDLDLKDNVLKTRIIVNGVEKYNNSTVHNGDVIQQSIPNVTANPGTITVRIEVEDNKGAKVIKETKVEVITPAATNLGLSRTVAPVSGIVAPNSVATLTYTITPQPFAASDISTMTGLRPFSLEEGTYTIGQEIVLMDTKDHGNFGAVAFDKNGAKNFRNDIETGYQYEIKIGDPIQTEPGNKANSAQTQIKGLQDKVISVPIVRQLNDKSNGRYDLEVRGFAILKVTEIDDNLHIRTQLLSYQTASVYKVANLAIAEKFPAKVELAQIPASFTKSGTIGTGYTLNGKLSEITYTKNGTQYTSQPLTFTVQVNPTENGVYVLDQSNVTFTGLNGSTIRDQFNPITLRAETRVTSIQVSPSSKTLNVGETFKLISTVTPDTASNKAIIWTSSNPSVATVDENGIVTGITAGNAVITAASAENSSIKATSNITVKVPVTSISLDKTGVVLRVGETDTLTATIMPANATNKDVVWSSSDSSILSITPNGLSSTIRALKSGEATITVTSVDSQQTATCKVTVEESVDQVQVSPNEKIINVGEKVQLTATVLPVNSTNKNVTWSSANSTIASVSNTGLVTGLKPGKVIITATSADGKKTGQATITVKQPVTGVSIDPSTITLVVGDDPKHLTAVIQPADATNQDVSWSSSNDQVVTVDQNGNVTGVKAGTATITVSTDDGNFKATCSVKVIDKTLYEVFYDVNGTKPVPNDNTWLDRPVYVKLTYSDETNKTYRVTNRETGAVEEKTYSGLFLVDKNGINEIEYYEKPSSSSMKQQLIKLDLISLAVTITGGTVNQTDRVVTDISITAKDSSVKGNGSSGLDYILVWTDNNPPAKYNQSTVIYNTSATTNLSVTVYAQAVSKSGKESPIATQTYVFDSKPPTVTIGPGFIHQPNGDRGAITIKTSVTDDVSGVLDVSYRIEKAVVSGATLKFEKTSFSGSLQSKDGYWYATEDVGTARTAAGYYKVIITATDKVGNKTKQVDEQWDVFMVSPGYTLAGITYTVLGTNETINSNQPILSAKPIKVSFAKDSSTNSAFKTAIADQVAVVRVLDAKSRKDLLNSLANFDLKVSLIEYSIVKKGEAPSVWKRLQTSDIVIQNEGEWEIYFRVTDNYTNWGAKAVTNSQVSQPVQIKTNLKKL
ncbi:DUF5057 domain-containing protein [Brevibacillus ginsengisoli]|uniref:DUF5057 domain-containing protein n=1 Tax=Brevibacillus ginsengisoli TaxID=363854 RepID=UPI003CF116DF